MYRTIYPISNQKKYKQAGPDDLIEFLPPPGEHPLIISKGIAEILVYGVVNREKIHLSGRTGQAKTKLINDLVAEPKNFEIICHQLGYPVRPLKVFACEMAMFEAPSELWQRRSLENGNTFDELSILMQMLKQAAQLTDTEYPVIHLKEFGRVHSSAVQAGLPNIMAEGTIRTPDNQLINGRSMAWLADSNYQDADGQYTLVNLDDALKRRFTLHICMEIFSPDQELAILQQTEKFYQ
jgi:hypothetical protein